MSIRISDPEALEALRIETLYDLVPSHLRDEVAKVIHDIQNRLASIETAGEILACEDVSEDDRRLLEELRDQAVQELLEIVRGIRRLPEAGPVNWPESPPWIA